MRFPLQNVNAEDQVWATYYVCPTCGATNNTSWECGHGGTTHSSEAATAAVAVSSTNKAFEKIAYGKTVYLPIISVENAGKYLTETTEIASVWAKGDFTANYAQFTKSDDISGLKVSAKWDDGKFTKKGGMISPFSRGKKL